MTRGPLGIVDWGADEPGPDDVTADDPGGPFYYHGRKIARTRTDLQRWMRESKFWPSVWWISDHGNAHAIDLAADSPRVQLKRSLAGSKPRRGGLFPGWLFGKRR